MSVYLDYAATTPVDPRVADYMAELLGTDAAFANPASDHGPGRRAGDVVASARRQVAAAIGGDPEDVVWTSGATEANNLALDGVAAFHRRAGRGCHIITSATAHASVLEPLAALERGGVRVTRLPVSRDGIVDVAGLEAALADDTRVVSITHVNNETGVIQNLEAIAERLAGREDILFHVDAAQSVGKVPLDLNAVPADMVSLSAHKLCGPKGVGALYARARARRRLAPLLRGGGQEGGLRSGTVATHQVAGMGLAFELAVERSEETQRLSALSERLYGGLAACGEVYRIGAGASRSPHILSLFFAGIHARALQAWCPELAASVGSACNASTGKPSHVLRAMGIPDGVAQCVLRLSLGRFTTEPQVDEAVSIINGAVAKLRNASPIWHDHERGLPWKEVYGIGEWPFVA